jgi:hypothetical protein
MHFNPWRLCTTVMSVPALPSGASVQHRPTGGSSGLLAQPLSHNHVGGWETVIEQQATLQKRGGWRSHAT